MSGPYADFAAIRRAVRDLPAPSRESAGAARARQDQRTVPAGSLGRLGEVACWLAGWQGRAVPALERVRAVVFAGNHGVYAQGVAPYPQDTTARMVALFRDGRAAINQLCAVQDVPLAVVPLDLEQPTADFTRAPAMTPGEALAALNRGAECVDGPMDALVLGEMGIANSTVAAALACALFGGRAADWVGRGTGLDEAGVAHKAGVVEAALARHAGNLDDPLAVLARLGGREQAALAGAILAARQRRIPVILDGFICCAAAAVLHRLRGDALDHCLVGHRSAERGHLRLVEALGKTPLLDLDLRLGEGSGAALAVGLLRGAVACHGGSASGRARVAAVTGPGGCP